VELDDADKATPWQPNSQRELPAPRGQFSRKDRRDVLAQSLEDKSAEPRSGYRTASGRGVFNRERSWQLGGARERTPTRPRVCWRTHGRTFGRAPSSCLGPTTQFGAHADNSNYQRACRARARLGVLADAAPLDGRRRATQSAFPTAELCRRPVPGALPRARRTSRASTCWWLFSLWPIRVSQQCLCLSVVTVARLVQILGAPVALAGATRQARSH
jgi:hypothetical protein